MKILWHFSRCRIFSGGFKVLNFKWESYTSQFQARNSSEKSINYRSFGRGRTYAFAMPVLLKGVIQTIYELWQVVHCACHVNMLVLVSINTGRAMQREQYYWTLKCNWYFSAFNKKNFNIQRAGFLFTWIKCINKCLWKQLEQLSDYINKYYSVVT